MNLSRWSRLESSGDKEMCQWNVCESPSLGVIKKSNNHSIDPPPIPTHSIWNQQQKLCPSYPWEEEPQCLENSRAELCERISRHDKWYALALADAPIKYPLDRAKSRRHWLMPRPHSPISQFWLSPSYTSEAVKNSPTSLSKGLCIHQPIGIGRHHNTCHHKKKISAPK